jgi:hypothetical protein
MPLPLTNVPRYAGRTGSEVSTPLPSPGTRSGTGGSSPRLGLPSRVSPLSHRGVTPLTNKTRRLCMPVTARSSRGFYPFSVLPAMGSHLTRRVPPHPVTLRPQGFSPSRRFAPPMTCRPCFMPVPLMGFTLRGLAPPDGAVRPLGRRAPREVGSSTAAPGLSFRVWHTTGDPAQRPGV